ncbi:MAG TPA: hypothetical protein VFM51_06165 [Solirubrobacterales bacterium]|nr:hypothetical protein [Solirubrobacterales bacterium]
MGTSSTVRKLLNWTHLDQLFTNATERFERRRGERAEAAFRKAIETLAAALDEKCAIRNDGFFDQGDDETPSDAEQIFEGVLRAAAESHESRKAERMGELYAYFALHVDVSPAHANFLLGLTDRLTYQQLLLLGLLEEGSRPMDIPDFDPTGFFTHAEIGILFELHDLAREGLLVRDDHRVITSFSDVNPVRLRTVLNGKVLVEAMNLRKAEPADWDGIKWAFARLGKIDTGQAVDGHVRVEAVVLPGSPEDTSRVKMDKQLVEFRDPVVRLEDLPDV